MRATEVRKPITPAIFYIGCCMLGFIHYQSLISTIEALLFPKKLVFRVGKKALVKKTNYFAILVSLLTRTNCKFATLVG